MSNPLGEPGEKVFDDALRRASILIALGNIVDIEGIVLFCFYIVAEWLSIKTTDLAVMNIPYMIYLTIAFIYFPNYFGKYVVVPAVIVVLMTEVPLLGWVLTS